MRRGKIGGTLEAPVVKLTARAMASSTATSASTSSPPTSISTGVDSALRTPISPSRSSRSTQRSLTQFNATLDGTTAEHTFEADALADKTSLHMSGKGGFADGVWTGTIGDLFIDDTANINLQLDTPVKVRGKRQGGQARCPVHARQGRPAVRQRRME